MTLAIRVLVALVLIGLLLASARLLSDLMLMGVALVVGALGWYWALTRG